MITSGQTSRKVDFRITNEEYEVLLICAKAKGMTVSRYLRSLVAACIAPAILTTTKDMRDQLLRQVNQQGGADPV